MDPILAQMTTGSLDDEKLSALSKSLRAQSAVGGRLSTSSLDNIADAGKNLQESATKQAKDIGLQQSKTAQRKSQELMANNRLLATAAKAQSLAGERGMAKLSNAAIENIEGDAENLSNSSMMYGTWKPEYAAKTGTKITGKAGRTLASNFPIALEAGEFLGVLPEGESDRLIQSADWWALYDKYVNNIIRHDLFGSALTAPETELWEQSTIHPGMTAEQMDTRLAQMKLIDTRHRALKIMQLQATNVPREMIRVNYALDWSEEDLDNAKAIYDQTTEKIGKLAGQKSAEWSNVRNMSDEDLNAAIAARGGQ
jgi:hypothetical protein